MSIGTRIKELRSRAGLTQEALARKIGVTPSAVGNYERDFSFPKEEVLYLLFGALGCSPNELFETENPYSAGELEHLEKYRFLDDYGRELVNACTEIELARQRGEITAIAARKGTPDTLVLKKRAGAPDIREAPDYRGGR